MDINTEKRTCTCRIILPVQKNEELTIEYNTRHRWEPIHERRFNYLVSKEFTCHCPRCDALGDDMRQCDCFAEGCNGVMMVCQPLNTKPIPGNISSYSGVEYVRPHLLPCTECRRAAPAGYEKEMLAMEALLPAKLDSIELQDAELARAENKEAAQDLLAELCTFADRCPGRHKLALQAKRLKGFLYTKLSKQFGSYYHVPLARAMQDNIEIYELLTKFPNKAVHQFYVAIAEASRLNPAYPVQNTLHYYRLGVRMQLVMQGRERRERSYDKGLLSVLLDLPAEAVTLSHCAFCGESPLRAAVTLSCCGKCEKVCYCSVGCQRAHWKLHKRMCKSKDNDDDDDDEDEEES